MCGLIHHDDDDDDDDDDDVQCFFLAFDVFQGGLFGCFYPGELCFSRFREASTTCHKLRRS